MVINLLIAGGVAFSAVGSAVPSAGQSNGAPGVYAVSAITAGEFAQAEKILQPENHEDARDPARLINIATVYARTQRYAQAREALRIVSDLPSEPLELSDGKSYSSHLIASTLLQRLDRGTQLTAR